MKLTEAAYIGEELFGNADYELERQFKSVLYAEERGLMSHEEAIEAYGITEKEYRSCLARFTVSWILTTPENKPSVKSTVLSRKPKV